MSRLAALLLGFGLALTSASAVRAQEAAAPATQPAETTVVRTVLDKVLVWARNPSRVIATLPQGPLAVRLREAQTTRSSGRAA